MARERRGLDGSRGSLGRGRIGKLGGTGTRWKGQSQKKNKGGGHPRKASFKVGEINTAGKGEAKSKYRHQGCPLLEKE